ncbi:MAG: pyridoxal phosphate-dependent aminotransferase [Candidatus Omnitrophica bacterium]|jgi:aspartate aminotransferase|nr:pyridoxal phosphate-dependent aminotransferase [Candidatus Omnitrophota bacterium]MDD5080764.1 pyridoxal phosphate-dependent aminotransferase [Candidatus Omnitrophota bacterium]MDD5440896.1 pyridoxal phosphate-dependent aminotransferase [Candidatus Omnitrophota bacterium]
MLNKINSNVEKLNKSATLKITALTKKMVSQGKDVVNFAAGEPDFDTPDFIKQAAKIAIDKGFTKYTPSAGLPALREAIAKKLNDENGMNVSAANIIVTAGAKYAIYVGLLTVVEPGDEIIVPVPYWVSYPEMAALLGARMVNVATRQEDGFKLKPSELAKAVTSKTRVLILNYPSNPTGVTYTKEELEEILKIAKKNNFYVLSDEIYEKLIYDGSDHVSFASLPGAQDLTITVNGFSKAFSMTGWRLGYLVANDEFIGHASKIIDHTTSCSCTISQHAAIAALADITWQAQIQKEFQNRRDLLYKGLSGIKNFKPMKSNGTFYMFCDVSGTGLSSFDFASRLLEEKLVSCIPADSFGADGFVRLSFATSSDQINKGIIRIKEFVESL